MDSLGPEYRSMRLHWNAAGGYWPTQGVGFKTVAEWMPKIPHNL